MKKIFLTLIIVVVAGVVIYPIAAKTVKSKAVTPVTNNTSVLNDKTTTQTVTPSSIKNSKSIKNSNDKIATASTKNVNSSTSTAVKEISSTPTTATTKNTASQSKESLDTKKNINSQNSLVSSDTVNTNITNTNNVESSNAKTSVTKPNNNNSNNIDSSNSKIATNKASTSSSKTKQNSNNENTLNATTINSSTFNSSVFNQIKTLANPGTAFVANLNSYKIVNGVKYYNVYQYSIDKSSKGWVYDGNYSNFIGARYMSVTGALLNNQYIQNFDSLTNSQKKSTLYNLAKQFTSYFPEYNASINVDMNKTKDVDGYHCYLINWGKRSFYINLAGYIFVNKSQSFY